MSYEEEEEKKKREQGIRKIEVVHKHIHEKKLSEDDRKAIAEMEGESPEDVELLEKARIIATVGFASEKRSLAQEYPKYSDRIRECETPAQLAEIMEEIEVNEVPKSAPTGSIKLKPSEVASSFKDNKKFANARDLLNSLVHKMAFGRSPQEKAEAKKKYETLLRSMLTNPNIKYLGTTRKMPHLELVECPRCGAGMELGTKICPACSHEMGNTERFTSVAYAPSKWVKESK